ncbi:integrase [Actinobacillus delphinicola]|uniref:Integrase n=1 Tax=Actinobacillus delphinicola TaxID=51161 RepID=A0A448TU24_9PAST|nr:integrase [Actinobacillus delphinicola]
MKSSDIIEWRRVILLRLKPVSWNNYVRHLKAIYAFGIDQALLPKPNPFKYCSLRIGKPQKKIFNPEQIKQINDIFQQEHVPDWCSPLWFYEAVIKTLFYTAIRRRQLLNLTIENVDLNRGIFSLPASINKNDCYHELPISKALRPALEKLLLEHELRGSLPKEQLFNRNKFTLATYRQGKEMTSAQLTYFFEKLSALAGFRITPHRFRHTVATNLMKNPKNLYVVKQLLGHSSVNVTLEYIHDDPETLRNIVDNI